MAAYTDAELLKIVGDERSRSIGFEHDADLTADRDRALRFMKGDMRKEMPTQRNRSEATSTDVIDAVNTLTPDLMEILTGGDDVVAFRPNGPEDEAGAQQETDYVRHVVFSENDGFMLFNTFIMDALSQKTGVLKYWREEGEATEERVTGQSAVALHMAVESSELLDIEPSADQPDPNEIVYDATLRQAGRGRITIAAVAPEDFTVAADTMRVPDATYCAHRTRIRVQDLRARGIDEDTLAKLPAVSSSTSSTAQARDTAGESLVSQSSNSNSNDDLRQVETVEHYIRLWEDDRLVLWRVLTGSDESVLIEREEVNRIPFAAITPFVVTHRFYGQSVADLLTEQQKIGTALTRMVLDSGYFALNQRMEVSEDDMGDLGMLDLLQNEPGRPIRTKTGQAVRPISAGQINFDVFGALEYFQSKAEQHTGVVRNAQGLNPDTLHDTAKGAMIMMRASAKRVRMIARIFAETGVKDLYLGVHALIREDGVSHKHDALRLCGSWQPVDPTSWGERMDMTVEVGLGASGQEHDIAVNAQMLDLTKDLISLQGGEVTETSPYIRPNNVHSQAERVLSRMGIKRPDLFLSNPADLKNMPQPEPPPDPKMIEMQGRLKLQAAEMQGDMQLEKARTAGELELERAKAAGRLRLEHEQQQGELALRGQEMQTEADLRAITAFAGGSPSSNLPAVQFGGVPG